MASPSRYSNLVRRSLGRIRSRIEMEQTEEDDDDFVTGFNAYRSRQDSRPGTSAVSSYRKRKNPLYSFKVCCLKEPMTTRINPMLIRRLNSCKLGSRKIVIGRNESMVKFRKTIREMFPPLGMVDYTFYKASATTGNQLIPVTNIYDLRSLKQEIRFKSLYVMPEHLLPVEPEVESTPTIISQNPTTEGDSIPRMEHRPRQQRRAATAANNYIAAVPNAISNHSDHSESDGELEDPHISDNLETTVRQRSTNRAAVNSDARAEVQSRGRPRGHQNLTMHDLNWLSLSINDQCQHELSLH